ncbi:ZIP family metal transporter [Phaeodactylibacter sp.]|uniref:ZIP family metal transporter n=1 Tax=Phaeodactylibacter sp. TaxID=1940289 RepID=UPI0025E4353B|nr:ZIP family metal transporter [Phaeodactylibacter sp.]MCI4646998.1 ZIP family metal transporter [Phaeodactylibacter sp.]MCI5093650.1 ZIP family metal transporter [Phaeodactylibacter sp.]
MDAILSALGNYHPVTQALLTTLFTWGVTALGAAVVFFFRQIRQEVLDAMLGFAAGVMIAASFWSLLAPAIDLSERVSTLPNWLPAALGFMGGGLFMAGVDKVLPHLHPGLKMDQAEGISTNWRRSVLLVLAITLHNIPEGLAVGVAFGAVAHGLPSASIGAAVALAVGIGLQNFPEGTAVSVPLRREGFSRRRAFWYGQMSGAVEPVAGIVGAAAVMMMQPILPYALSFAAGAMIFVVVEELIPESQQAGNTDLATIATLAGFTLMMSLDVALG